MLPKEIETVIMEYVKEFAACECLLHKVLLATWHEFLFWHLVDINRDTVSSHFQDGNCSIWLLIFASQGQAVFESCRYSEILSFGGMIEEVHTGTRNEDFVNYYQFRSGLEYSCDELNRLVESIKPYEVYSIIHEIKDTTPPYKLLHEVFHILKTRQNIKERLDIVGPYGLSTTDI